MLSSRVTQIRPSATLAMDQRSRDLRAHGVDLVSFATGEPDFATADDVIDAAIAAARLPISHRYGPVGGKAELREAIAQESNRSVSSAEVGAADVLVTNGAKQAIFSAIGAIVENGDEVLLPVPYWSTYPETIRFFGGRPIEVIPSDLSRLPNVAELQTRVSGRTKLLVWCSPGNPSGAVADAAQTREVFHWARSRGLWILSDEIYRKLYYGEGAIPTMRGAAGGDYSRLVVVDGVSKAYAMTGWRVGWSIAAPEVIAAMTRLQGHLSSNVSGVAQAAAQHALSSDGGGPNPMLEAFRKRRDLIVDGLGTIPGVRLAGPAGAFYVFPDISEAIKRLRLDSSATLAEWLLEKARVVVVPGEAFGAPGHIRLSYALSDDRLAEGVSRIARAMTQ